MKNLGIETSISNNNSRAQAHSERGIQTTILKLLKEMNEQDSLSNWHQRLQKLQFNINNSPSTALRGLTPFQITRRYNIKNLTPIIEPIRSVSRAANNFNELSKIFDNIRLTAYKTMMMNKDYYYPMETLKEGQIVFRKRTSFSKNMSPKLQQKVMRAYKVVRKVASGLYELSDVMDDFRLRFADEPTEVVAVGL